MSRPMTNHEKPLAKDVIIPMVHCGECIYCTNNWHSSVYDMCGKTDKYVSDDDPCSCGEGRKRE